MSGGGMKEGRQSRREANPWGAEKAREGKMLSEASSGLPCSPVDVAEREQKPRRGAASSRGSRSRGRWRKLAAGR